MDAAVRQLGQALATMPDSVCDALHTVAVRDDLPLVAGSWSDSHGGCLVANAVAVLDGSGRALPATLDLRILELLPELSSRDLNRLIVAWDEAADTVGTDPQDADLRRLLSDALSYCSGREAPSVASTVTVRSARNTSSST